MTSPDSSAPIQAGGPPEASRRADPADRILRAARELFFTEGFAGVSTDRLARAAGVSKSTLYKRFGDMAGVLRAVAEAEADHVPLGDAPAPATAQAFAKRLAEMGAELIALIEQPDKVRFDRLVLEQSRAHPELAEVYYEAIYARTQAQLAAFLQEGQLRGVVRQDLSPAVLADHLLSMWQGLAGARFRLGLSPTDTRSDAERSRHAVATLLGQSGTRDQLADGSGA